MTTCSTELATVGSLCLKGCLNWQSTKELPSVAVLRNRHCLTGLRCRKIAETEAAVSVNEQLSSELPDRLACTPSTKLMALLLSQFYTVE